MAEVVLPGRTHYRLAESQVWPQSTKPPLSRIVYATPHVVGRETRSGEQVVDWETTMGLRNHLWKLGLGVADAMDTCQRGLSLDWVATQRLIARSGTEARAAGGSLACGAGTDQISLSDAPSISDICSAYEQQMEVVEQAGATVILMPSRALAATARDAEHYVAVYSRLLEQSAQPVIIDWLGESLDPALYGYWGAPGVDQAQEVLLALVRTHERKVAGLRLALLDVEREVRLRRLLPKTVALYTGDVHHYPELVAGDELGFSHAVLSVFSVIAPQAAAALQALDAGDLLTYHNILAPTVPLARHLFAAPAYHYKTGLAFLSWLSGHQPEFRMLGGRERARPLAHLVQLFQLADAAGVLPDPDLAAHRMARMLDCIGAP